MPSPEPKPSEGGWLYRVLEPYYSRECTLVRVGDSEGDSEPSCNAFCDAIKVLERSYLKDLGSGFRA